MERIDKLPNRPPHFNIYCLFGMKIANSVVVIIVPCNCMSHNHQENSKPFNGINIFNSLFHIK